MAVRTPDGAFISSPKQTAPGRRLHNPSRAFLGAQNQQRAPAFAPTLCSNFGILALRHVRKRGSVRSDACGTNELCSVGHLETVLLLPADFLHRSDLFVSSVLSRLFQGFLRKFYRGEIPRYFHGNWYLRDKSQEANTMNAFPSKFGSTIPVQTVTEPVALFHYCTDQIVPEEIFRFRWFFVTNQPTTVPRHL